MADFDLNSSYIPALHKPSALLPVAKHRESLLYLVETCPVIVVVGQTGSGKTTQIPQFLDAAGWCTEGKIIGVTQPRRVAATTVAVRVAEEYGCELGKQVGYSIRFEDVTSAVTRIKFMTDGLLIREALVDPLLSRYAVIMIDEAHERSISTDILLGLLKKILRRRSDLHVIISSATLQADQFLNFFSENDGSNQQVGAIITLEGRTYPIDVLYLETPADDYVQSAVNTIFDIHSKEGAGDILVFLTGREEIDSALQAIADRSAQLTESSQIVALPLYAGLTTEQQMYVFEPAAENTRKVVLSTNIAEASVTLDGVAYVVDCGFVKLRAFNPQASIESLTVTPISKASAQQRAGRAGRTKPGKCFRLYTEDAYQALPDTTPPEIQRSNLAPFILQLKALGIDNVVRFEYFTPPPSDLLLRATELLFSLGALDEYAKLTRPLGMRMAELAVEPMMAKTLLSSPTFGCLDEILTIAAMTTLGGSVFYSDGSKRQLESARWKFAADEGDHITLLNVYQAFVGKGKMEAKFCHENYLNHKSMIRAVSIRAQLRRYMERFDMTSEQPQTRDTVIPKAESIRRCLTSGYFAHAAKMQADGTFINVAGNTVLHAHPSSLMFNRKADWVIFHEVVESGNKTFLRDITKIEKAWLLEYASAYYQLKA
ncbi:ATP-dependent RNA helicase DDX35 [Microdochium nivale]|nr:ATP-dependent RNA helicase DDX35 [Microdochium nivale]